MSASAIFAVAGAAFWYEDWRYSRPTPRPAALVQPPIGSPLPIDRWLAEARHEGGLAVATPLDRPVLVHFFNPDCPCSRFNLDHLRALHARFGDRVRFVAAIQADVDETEPAVRALEDRLASLELRMDHFIDRGGRIAAEAGVYSTPQAVLVDAAGTLRFRGNYNTSRYCTDPRTQFVRIALEALAQEADGRRSAIAHLPELPAYGCQLPSTHGEGSPPDRAGPTELSATRPW